MRAIHNDGLGQPGPFVVPSTPAAMAQSLLAVNRARNAAFGADMFAAGAWEILLALQSTMRAMPLAEIATTVNGKPDPLRRWASLLIAGRFIEETPAGYTLGIHGAALLAQVLTPAASSN